MSNLEKELKRIAEIKPKNPAKNLGSALVAISAIVFVFNSASGVYFYLTNFAGAEAVPDAFAKYFLATSVGISALSIGFFIVGLGLKKLKSWSARAAIMLSGVSIMTLLTIFVNYAIITPHDIPGFRTTAGVLSLIFSIPFLFLIGYVNRKKFKDFLVSKEKAL